MCIIHRMCIIVVVQTIQSSLSSTYNHTSMLSSCYLHNIIIVTPISIAPSILWGEIRCLITPKPDIIMHFLGAAIVTAGAPLPATVRVTWAGGAVTSREGPRRVHWVTRITTPMSDGPGEITGAVLTCDNMMYYQHFLSALFCPVLSWYCLWYVFN